MRKVVVFAIAWLLIVSCTKEKLPIDNNNLIVGTWTFSHSDIDTNIYLRSKDFIQTLGYKFYNDGILTARSYAGFCATPPVSYSDFQGTWTKVSDSLINVNIAYWGGTTSYKLKTVSVDYSLLKVLPFSNKK
jgi:hypothetical protein